jgi:hypothetical protein
MQSCSGSALNDDLKNKVSIKAGIAHAKEMHDQSSMLNTFSATTITKLKLRLENYKKKLKKSMKRRKKP